MTDTRRERAALCDLLDQLGPDQPTKCGGWLTRDLTAHLLLRERRPLTALGIVLPPLAAHTARVQRRLAERPFTESVAALRQPPGWSPARLDRLDQTINSLELFIHHEDVRRAQPQWQPRELPAPLATQLWSRVRTLARLRLRRFSASVMIEAPGYGQLTTGRAGSESAVKISGDPGELAIFFTGRQDVARLSLTGAPELTQRISNARLGL